MGSAAVYALQFLDMLGFKSLARKGFAEQAKPESHPYAVYTGAKELIRIHKKMCIRDRDWLVRLSR